MLIDAKKIESLTKIKVDPNSDFIFDIKKISKKIFAKYSIALKNLESLSHPCDIH